MSQNVCMAAFLSPRTKTFEHEMRTFTPKIKKTQNTKKTKTKNRENSTKTYGSRDRLSLSNSYQIVYSRRFLRPDVTFLVRGWVVPEGLRRSFWVVLGGIPPTTLLPKGESRPSLPTTPISHSLQLSHSCMMGKRERGRRGLRRI